MLGTTVLDLTNQRFGALVVIARAGTIRKYAAWQCRCDCGYEVVVRGDRLRNGKRKACTLNGHRWKPAALRSPTLIALHPSEHAYPVNTHTY